jgi:hypothetical protein
MARLHGRNGIVYIGISAPAGVSAAASPVAYLSDWSINFTVNKVEVTAMGDKNLIYVAGLPDASGDFSGLYDDATSQTYVSATDGVPRNFYLYPSLTADPTQYFFGIVLPDFSVTGGVAAALAIKSTWNAAGPVQRYTQWGGLVT